MLKIPVIAKKKGSVVSEWHGQKFRGPEEAS